MTSPSTASVAPEPEALPGRRSSSPLTIFFLVLPFGISSGFATVTLPFALTKAGFSVAAAGSIVALAISANLWRFVVAPVADLTLSLRRWYLIGLAAAIGTLLLLAMMPLDPKLTGMLTIVAFISQVAATLVILPIGGLIAHTVADSNKGRAGGGYQAGNVGGVGLGGGAGVWLVTHYSMLTAGLVLALAMLACGAALRFVPDVHPLAGGKVLERLRGMGKDFKELVQSPMAIFTIALLASAAGSGAATNLFSAVADEWRASPDLVALTTGALSGLCGLVGAVIGGWVADRFGRFWGYFGFSVLLAMVTTGMAIAPHSPTAYGTGVLAYNLALGMMNAAWSAVVLFAIGRGAASTKYALLSSLGNLPVSYMTAIDGWAHDKWGANGMLNTESVLGVLSVVLALPVLWWVTARRRN